jgi:type 1 glutamine amidotransferase
MQNVHRITRRQALQVLGAAAAAGAALPGVRLAHAEDKPRKKILFFTKSSGFEHDVIKRKGSELGLAEKTLIELGAKHGFDVTATKDGTVFDGDLSAYDAFFFYTTGNLLEPGNDKQPPMTAKGKAALLAAIESGKGFLGSHCASDTFHSGKAFEIQEKPDPYIAMLGGEFIRHGPQQDARVRVIDAEFPGQKAAGKEFKIKEEWYSLKNFAPDIHVLLVLETEGMDGLDYQRPPFPLTWARMHGKGRVYFTALGHRDDVWTSPLFQGMLAGALAWATGGASGDVKPNLKEATPQASVLPPEREKKKEK